MGKNKKADCFHKYHISLQAKSHKEHSDLLAQIKSVTICVKINHVLVDAKVKIVMFVISIRLSQFVQNATKKLLHANHVLLVSVPNVIHKENARLRSTTADDDRLRYNLKYN